MPFILGTNSIKDTGYDVANSCRFDDGSSAYLSKADPGASGNRKTWTLSLWFKRGNLGTVQTLFSSGGGHLYEGFVRINASDRLEFKNDGQYGGEASPTRVLRDVGAWYHLCWSVDATQGSNDNRWKIYLNGTLIPASEYSSVTIANADGNILDFDSNASDLAVGRRERTDADYWDGYISEVTFIDGTQAAVTSFGEFDDDSPTIWKPKDVSGLTFGNNGFYLDFEDSSALGNDAAGSNNFTVNNLTSIDQSTDTCTNNFATANPLLNTTPTYSEGNLNIVTTNGNNLGGVSTIGVNTGKWYAEFKVIANDTCAMLGIDSDPSESARLDASTEAFPGRYATGYGYSFNGNKFNNNSDSSYGNTYTTNDIIGIALDLDNNKLYFSKNGTFQNSGDPTSGATGTGAISITDPSSQPTGNYFFVTGDGSRSRASTFSCNFGSPSFSISSGNADANGFGNFEYAVPSGYYSLNTKNLSEFG